MTEFPEYTYSPMFVSTHVALAWEASRTSFDRSSDLVWMNKHGCSSQRRLRICLIALNAWSLSSLLHGKVCIDGPLLCNADMESWITHAWGVSRSLCSRWKHLSDTPQSDLFLLKSHQTHHGSALLIPSLPVNPFCRQKKTSEGFFHPS